MSRPLYRSTEQIPNEKPHVNADMFAPVTLAAQIQWICKSGTMKNQHSECRVVCMFGDAKNRTRRGTVVFIVKHTQIDGTSLERKLQVWCTETTMQRIHKAILQRI